MNCQRILNNMSDSNYLLCDQSRFNHTDVRNTIVRREILPTAAQVKRTEVLDQRTIVLKGTDRPEYANRIQTLKGAAQQSTVGKYTVPDIRVSNKPTYSIDYKLNVAKGREVGVAYDPEMWKFRKTIKEETENNKYQRINVNSLFKKSTRQTMDRQKTTIKQQTLLENYTGTMGSGDSRKFMDRTNAYNAQYNGLKEATLPGRMPVPQGAKVANGMTAYNMESTNTQYNIYDINKRISRSTNIAIPNQRIIGDFSRQPQLYDDSQLLCDRINPSILSQFKNNPYSQSLTSHIYPYNPSYPTKPGYMSGQVKNNLSELPGYDNFRM